MAAALVAGLVEPLGFQWLNHPNQVEYVQPLAGGPAGAFGRYDLDYWGNCMLQSMERLARQHPQQRVRVTGWPLVVADERESVSLVRRRSWSGGGSAGTKVPACVQDGPTYSIELARGRREQVFELESMPDVSDRVTTADGAVLCVTRAAATPLPQSLFEN